MKVTKKIPFAAYTAICVVLLLALLAGIVWLTNFSQHSKSVSGYWNQEKVTTETFAIDTSATSFEVKSLFGNVTIKTTSEKPYVKIDSSYKLNADIKTQDGVCVIDFKGARHFNSNFINNLFRKHIIPVIEIYLPEQALTKVNLTSSAGELIIDGLKASLLEVNVSAGSVNIENCILDGIKTQMSAGNIVFRAINGINSIDSIISAGNMDLYLPRDIDGIYGTYDVSVGSLEDQTSFGLLDDKESGINREGNFSYLDQSCKIKLEASAGNINIKDYR